MISFFNSFKGSIGKWLLFIGCLLIVLGARLFVGIRFVAELPQSDDFDTLYWLQAWKLGDHNWSFIFLHHVNVHPMEFYYLLNLGQFLANGAWDGRLDFISASILHTLYAGVALIVLGRLALPQQRLWISGLILTIFIVPFGGYRIAWGLLWLHTTMIMFAILAIYAASRPVDKWGRALMVIVLVALASLNNAAGCLTGLVVGGLLLLRMILNRRIILPEVLTGMGSLIIFLSFYSVMPVGHQEVLGWSNVAFFLRTIGWPIIFTPIGGTFTLVTMAGLAFGYVFQREFRCRQIEALVGIGAYLIMVGMATGFLRSTDPWPSGRYTDILIAIPVICALSLSWLIQMSRGARRRFWQVFATAWCLLQMFGFGMHFLYRVLPFMADNTGEWVEPDRQDRLRDVNRGMDVPIVPFGKTDSDTNALTMPYGVPWTAAQATGREPFPAMTIPMIAGFPIQTGSTGNFVSGGYPPSYMPRPGEHYVGSYDLKQLLRDGQNDRTFRSGPFQPTSDYLTMDLLVDKSARLSFYCMDGVQLNLMDETSSQMQSLIPLLRNTYPSIFRDWELIYFPVIPGHTYHLESRVNGTKGSCWLAFGEPRESGRLTPFIIGFSQSGKLFCLIGFLLVTTGVIVLAFSSENEATIL